MSFASALDRYCTVVNCTNAELAAACGISPSTVSRYRSSGREPKPDAAIVGTMARAFADLSQKPESHERLQEGAVHKALQASITETNMVGMNFNMRFDTIMQVTGMTNALMAEAAQVDPSYISRIRKGTRTPGDMKRFINPAARMLAQACLDKGLLEEVGELVGDMSFDEETFSSGYDENSHVAEAIAEWLVGNEIIEADIAELEELFTWLDTADFSEMLAIANSPAPSMSSASEPLGHVARFYYGLGGMRNAELDFLKTAAETHARELSLSSDVPLLQMQLDRAFINQYKQSIARLLENGCHINVVFGVERPLGETIKSLKLWIPFYLTGRVSPYYLHGIHNRLFCHVNYVCETCALASEAMIGHQEDGRYFYTTRPVDVAYFQKKLGFILERSSRLFEMYHDSVPHEREAFAQMRRKQRARGGERLIGKGRYERLQVTFSAANCVVLTLKTDDDVVHFVIRHPKISYAASRMK